MKLKDILENKILIPRRSKEERQKNLAAVHYRQIQEYIKNGSKGHLDLNGTPLKTLPPNLIRVGGGLNLYGSQITSLGNLEHVGCGLWLRGTPITSLGNLEYVGEHLDLNNSQITSLGNLKHVEGNLWLEDSQITSLGNLKYVGEHLDLDNSQITSLGNLEYVGGNLFLDHTPISETHTEEQIRKQVKVERRIKFQLGY
jgi:hypothetical protein